MFGSVEMFILIHLIVMCSVEFFCMKKSFLLMIECLSRFIQHMNCVRFNGVGKFRFTCLVVGDLTNVRFADVYVGKLWRGLH